MAESVLQPDADPGSSLEQIHETPASDRLVVDDGLLEQIDASSADRPVIWTPWFIFAFALVMVLGVSGESLLTSSWTNHLIASIWLILQIHVLLVALGWLVLGIITRSRWIRAGCAFGLTWTLFMTLNILTNVSGFNHGIDIQPYINVAACMAFLGTSIGISIEKTLLTSWDTGVFILTPTLSALGVILATVLMLPASIVAVENTLALAAMVSSLVIWWARPSCWKTIPGPTFLLGLVPLILLLFAAFNLSPQNIFLVQVISPQADPVAGTNDFLFAQFVQLCLILACMRMIQGARIAQRLHRN